jgi:two-component system, LytTR family, response regulator LytT
MNNLKIAIIEDEKITAINLEKMILKLEPGARILATLASVKQAREWLSSNQPDLIFMDIELGDGQSFDLFENLSIKAPVIFTTAYDQFAIKAFKANGIDYLLKPIDESELEAALHKFRNLINTGFDPALLKELFSSAQQKKDYKQRFMIQAGSRIRSIPVTDVAYFYFLEKAVFICTFENRRYPAEFSLDKLEEVVNPIDFFRINRKMIVSIKSIYTIYTLSKSRIKLELRPDFDEEVLVSFNKAPAFREWLNK